MLEVMPCLSVSGNSNPMRCLMCKQPLLRSIISGVRGADGPYSITFLNLPVLACPAGHERYFPIRHFEYLLAEFFSQNNLVAMNNRGDEDLLECPECGRFIDESIVTSEEFRFEVKLKDLEPFRVELCSPALKCHDCEISFSCPRDEKSHSSLGAAIRKAFDSLNLGPPTPERRLFKRIVALLHRGRA